MDDYSKNLTLRINPTIDKPAEEKVLTELEKFAEAFNKTFIRKFGTDDKSKNLAESLANTLGNMYDNVLNKLGNVLQDSLSELDNMMTYSTLANSEYRSLAFQYGFSGAEAYGFKKAKDIMGLTSEEDLFYAVSEGRGAQFQEIMSRYAEDYDRLYQSGFFEDYRQYQIEMADLKQELSVDLIKFFVDNKELIKQGMNALLKLTEFTIQSLSWIMNILSPGYERTSSERVAAVTDIITSYGGSNKNTSIRIDNTFNNVNSEDRTWLSNAGQLTYEQIIRAIGG